MPIKSILCLVGSLGLLIGTQSTAHASLAFANPGFESSVGDTLTDWTTGGSPLTPLKEMLILEERTVLGMKEANGLGLEGTTTPFPAISNKP